MLALFTIAHPLVDACSLGVLMAGGMSWRRVIAYNAMAFALQLPMGLVADARPGLVRGGFALGCALAAGAAAVAAAGGGGWWLLVAACVGNALFHLTAGKDVLDAHGGRGGPVGLFISTGALGLLAGRLGVERWAGAALSGFALALAAVAAVAVARWRTRPENSCRAPTPAASCPGAWELAALIGLFVLVAWRSWAGLAAGRISAGQGAALLFAGAAVTWCGKSAGGYLAEQIGRGAVTAASVCGSAALALVCPPENAVAWLALLFVAQLATGPVLSLLYDRTGRRGGMAFGLNCLGLFAGSL